MFEKKTSKTIKSVIKGLTIENGKIVDEEGIERDLEKVILSTFSEGDLFDFSVVSKSDETTIIQEDSPQGEEDD